MTTQQAAEQSPSPTSRGGRGRLLRGHVPGEVGIWVFIGLDMLAFALFFVVFLWERSESFDVFQESRATLSLTLGAISTLLLVTGSWFVVMGMNAVRRQLARVGPTMFALAFVCGLGFVFNKVLEYTIKINAGQGMMANDFYQTYFVFTGVHLFHLLIAMVVLGLMWRFARRPVLNDRDMRNLEAGASYWHLVDLLWLVLFTLFYVVR